MERLKKVPKTLLGKEDAGKKERERIEELCLARYEFALQERQNARRFIKILQSFLPDLLAIRSSIEADQALQEFASKYCESMFLFRILFCKVQGCRKCLNARTRFGGKFCSTI